MNDFDVGFFIDPDSPRLFVDQLGDCDGFFDLGAARDASATSNSLDASTVNGSENMQRASVDNDADRAPINETVYTDDVSDNDDGLYSDHASISVDGDNDEEELVDEEDASMSADGPLSWRVDHSTGDHKLKGKPEPTTPSRVA